VDSVVTNRPKNVPDEALNELFHGPLEEFTAARNELAKSLRSDGDPEAADWVKGLKKPSRAAWLVNQLAARKPKDVQRLLKAGEELRAAQEEMLAGSTDPEKLREVAAGEREAVDSLVQTAEALGREHGVGSQILDRVGETLQAATTDPEVAEAIEKGQLQKEQRATGIGLVGPATPKAPARGRKKDERAAAERRSRQQQAKRRKEAERKLATAEKRLEREQAKLDRVREAMEDAEEALHKAELDAHAARRALDEL
jgi:DNA repair exonuclease SbcCD ATPase subunit